MERNAVVTYGKDLADAEPNRQDVNLFASKASGHVTRLLNSVCVTCRCVAFQMLLCGCCLEAGIFPSFVIMVAERCS